MPCVKKELDASNEQPALQFNQFFEALMVEIRYSCCVLKCRKEEGDKRERDDA